MSEPFNIGQIRQREAERFAKYMEQQDNERKLEEDKRKLEEDERKLEEDKIRIENETILLKEMEIREEFDIFLSKLDIASSEIIIANNILDIDLHVLCFVNILENGKQFIDNLNFIQEITDKVMILINNVTDNTNSKFNVTLKNENTEAANRITNHIKLCLKLINHDDTSIDIELMHTQEDEEIAKRLQFEYYGENDNDRFANDFAIHLNKNYSNDDNSNNDYNNDYNNDDFIDDLEEFSYNTDMRDY